MSENVIQNFGILYREFVNYTNEYLKETGISFAESIILVNIGGNPGITQEEISVKLSIDRGAIARNIKALEQKGFVATGKSASDKRRKDLLLTEKGSEIYKLIIKKNGERLKKLFVNISNEEKEVFIRVCETLVRNAR